MTVRIEQQTGALRRTTLDRIDNLIVFIPDNPEQGKRGKRGEDGFPAFPYAEAVERRLKRTDAGARTAPLIMDLPNPIGTHLSLGMLPAEPGNFELLSIARAHVQRQLEHGASRIAVATPGIAPALRERILEAVTAAALATTAALPDYRSRKKAVPGLKHLQFFDMHRRIDFRRTQAEAEGNNLARELTLEPPNTLTPADYRRRIATLAREHGWRMRFLDSRALRRKRAGAFLAVAQGSPSDDAGIVELLYQPARARAKASELALVGKGICFDTGGVNLKPARYMQGMHEDMAGSAVALGTLLALSRLRVPFPVRCWLALAQNHIGPRAYKPTDVVIAADGTSIEVVHTDAEGRMVLADTLALASRERPALIIDYATLTGSCVQALGTAYSGAVTNRDALREEIVAAGRASGERVWPFPYDEDYDKALESRIADIKQCTLDSEADHILAARFLGRFVGDTPWVHIDMSSGSHKGGLAHVPTDATGFGVRFTLNLLLDRKAMDKTQ